MSRLLCRTGFMTLINGNHLFTKMLELLSHLSRLASECLVINKENRFAVLVAVN